jgi:dTDP-4-amino-4,6-dideoxygalactose transaminase
MRRIPFAPPEITEEDIAAVTEVLRSGWITTGPVTKEFEKALIRYTGANAAVALNSATAALELALRYFGVGPGDEVIVPAYTYSASAAVVCHTGATPVFVDIDRNTFNISAAAVAKAITSKTKAVMPVDIAGNPCDYDAVLQAVQSASHLFRARGAEQELLKRPLILADAAHSLGAVYKGQASGNTADISAFSFHAVKNLTTGEGGALLLGQDCPFQAEEFYKSLQLLSLHGQNKDALAKSQLGAWEYDILFPGYKCNMTDIAAALGLSQLKRYDTILERRKICTELYQENLQNDAELILPQFTQGHTTGSYHLYLMRIRNYNEQRRNHLIKKLAENGISANVHYKPLPSLTAYQYLGYKPENFPEAYKNYERVISLPLYNSLTAEEIDYISKIIKEYR